MAATPDTKTCASCGRAFARRKKWDRAWDEVRYCSAACRRRKVAGVDRELEAAILDLLGSHRDRRSICPSEAARHVGGEDWRALMEPARRAARRLVASGDVIITQRGRTVDPSSFRGPVRIERAR